MPARVRFAPSGPLKQVFTVADAEGALATTLFVDQSTSVALEDQNGSAIAPFRSLRQAIDFIANTNGAAWNIQLAFGDYSTEGTLSLLPSKRYIFDGPFRSSIIMRLPPMLWTLAGPDTCFVLFRNVEAGLVTVIDGAPLASVAVIVYENAVCNGFNAATAASPITLIISGISLASFETSVSTFVFAVARSAAINIDNGSIFAQNCQFDASCPLIKADNVLADGCSFSQSLQIGGSSVELRESRWVGTPKTLTFLSPPGVAYLDSNTQHSFDIATVSLVGGSIVATDQTYDSSYAIPIPEGSTTGQSTFGSQVTFAGASYRVASYISATHFYVQVTAVSAPTTIVLAVYQRPTGQVVAPLPLVASGSLLVTAPGTYLVPMTTLMRLVPGILFLIFGKISGGGNVTFRTYTTPTQDLLNDPATVPAEAYPTAFTSTLGVTASPPASFDPTPAGGLVTPAGASNVTALVRFATP